jgi:hypothetical protein
VELSGIEPLTPTLPVLIIAYWKGVFKGGDTKLIPFKGWCRCNYKVVVASSYPPSSVVVYASFAAPSASSD